MSLVVATVAMGAQGPGSQTVPTKVGIINIQQAILSTRDGQKAANDLQQRYEPKRKELEQKQNEINALREQLNRGSNTMSEEARQALMRQIDQKTRALNRDTEDAQADFEQDQNRILQELGQRMMVVIGKYARDNGYALILDVSSPQTPVLYAANGIDITSDIVALYDKNTPSDTAATSTPATPPPPKPATPATKK
ncbi:MAG: OmpH family outer membrane protein [Bryobacterales bacterium]|nr:OmpH family outer membrane protein [Bryobacteraceae bacterium]MDW8355019.1 OmpH family outer membrane protein [Bryobacterales bacterium]